MLIDIQSRRPEHYPYVLVPLSRYGHIQQVWRSKGKWILSNARNKVINNFTKQFNKILAIAHVDKGTFHDIRKTAITGWFRQGLSEYDVMTLAGHANFATTHKFYLAVANLRADPWLFYMPITTSKTGNFPSGKSGVASEVLPKQPERSKPVSQILVRFGTRGIFEGLKKKASKRKYLLAHNLNNEAEGTRTLNLRIDSPML